MLIKSLYFCDMNGSWKKKMTKITTDNKLCINVIYFSKIN